MVLTDWNILVIRPEQAWPKVCQTGEAGCCSTAARGAAVSDWLWQYRQAVGCQQLCEPLVLGCWRTYSSLSKVEANVYSEYLGTGIVPQALTAAVTCCDRCCMNTTVNRALNINMKDVRGVGCFFFPISFLFFFSRFAFSCSNNAMITAIHRNLLIGCA